MTGKLLLLLALLLTGCEATDDDDSISNPIDLDEGDDDDSGVDAPAPVDIPLPSSFAVTCSESEPNDIEVNQGDTRHSIPPWSNANDCGEIAEGISGPLLHVSGSISSIVWDSWDGDNDTYQFDVLGEIEPQGVLRWDPLQGDLDAQLWCASAGTYQKLFDGGLATANLAESAQATFAVQPGTTCWLFVVGYSGLIADYDFWLTAP
ncbi:MAG TPA: hypothetical protein DIU15_08625 [Deltaproteobacteria bacterium]|nr:hypothetical protein [Deltaproteobacteria bacterium]HCP46091.1 hypothetical protein [Deltaproteobacteria bacterium]|tara:strand:+ start:387 stop:1004 length:618 start_codon:yes stop_codon:yes gene_type:complete